MPDFVSVEIASLKALFSGKFRFRLPWFQRAYAWQRAEILRLMDDLIVAWQEANKKPRYLLGTVVIAKQPDSPVSALVDGHQRTMTLTILFSVLRDLAEQSGHKAQLSGLVGGRDPHLQPQENCAEICRDYVQLPGSTLKKFEGDTADLSENELNIIENRDCIRNTLLAKGMTPDALQRFADFVMNNCYVVVHIFRDENEAWNSLLVEEETRHEFSSAANAKASLASIVPSVERISFSQVWEQCETQVSAVDLNALLGHVLLLETRKLCNKPVEAEIAQVFALNNTGMPFVKDRLLPAAQMLKKIRDGRIGTSDNRIQIAKSIDRMSWVETQAFVPAALLWCFRNGEGGDTLVFFRQLERLVWMMRIAGMEGQRKLKRILELVGEIEAGTPVQRMKSLEIEKAMLQDAIENLRSANFDRKQFSRQVLRRISCVLGADPGEMCAVNCTLEHIFPRGKKVPKAWRDYVSGRAVKTFAHQLGNLTFLTGPQNREADNKSWEEKRTIYATSEFVLNHDLKELPKWDAAAINARTERLIRVLLGDWDIQLP